MAQDISESHMRAARAAVEAMRATDEFDDFLPEAAMALGDELIQMNPNLQESILSNIDETAIALAARRSDLEREAASAYARVFSEEELNAITEFYGSDVGQKVMDDAGIVQREIYEAAEIWQRGLARDLAQQVGENLAEQHDSANIPDEGETQIEQSVGE